MQSHLGRFPGLHRKNIAISNGQVSNVDVQVGRTDA
jgi:hypothetical protein